MGIRQSLVRAFLKLNIFARTPHVKEESGFISEEKYLKEKHKRLKNLKNIKDGKKRKINKST